MTEKTSCPHCGQNEDGYTVKVPAVLVYIGTFQGPDDYMHTETERDKDPTMARCNSCDRLFKL